MKEKLNIYSVSSDKPITINPSNAHENFHGSIDWTIALWIFAVLALSFKK